MTACSGCYRTTCCYDNANGGMQLTIQRNTITKATQQQEAAAHMHTNTGQLLGSLLHICSRWRPSCRWRQAGDVINDMHAPGIQSVLFASA